MQNKIKYRNLEIGEIIQKGDEYLNFYFQDWKPVGFFKFGERVTEFSQGYYRRKIIPVKKPVKNKRRGHWRILGPKDILRKGDEFLFSDNHIVNGVKTKKKTWAKTCCIGKTASPDGVNKFPIYRRFVPSTHKQKVQDKPIAQIQPLPDTPAPTPGFRLLEVGEKLQLGDQIYRNLCEKIWIDVSEFYFYADSLGRVLENDAEFGIFFQRKISAIEKRSG